MDEMNQNENIGHQPEELTPPDSVDYFIYRADVAREHKHTNFWMIAFFVTFSVFVATNIYWIWNEMQYEDVVITQEAKTDTGGNAIVSGTAEGDVNYYGDSKADDKNPETQDRR